MKNSTFTHHSTPVRTGLTTGNPLLLFFVIMAVQDTIGGESSVGKNTHSNVVPGSIAVASLISKRKPKNDTSEIEFIAIDLRAVSLKHQVCSIVGVYILAAQLSVPTCRNVGAPG